MSATKHRDLRRQYADRPLMPTCRNYGHLFIRDSFLGFPVGKPYCLRCGRKARGAA